MPSGVVRLDLSVRLDLQHTHNWTAYMTEISIETTNTAQTSSYAPLTVVCIPWGSFLSARSHLGCMTCFHVRV